MGGKILPTRINNYYRKLICVSRTIHDLSVWNKPLIDTCQYCWSSRANQALPLLANAGFQNRGVCLQAFPSFPSPSPLSFFAFRFISRAVKTENPVPRTFFAPKPNGNACYAGYRHSSMFLLNNRPAKGQTCQYSYFEKGCRKKNTRQSRKALWVVLSLLFFKEIWKNGTRGHWHMFVGAKGKQQKATVVRNSVSIISHTYYLSRLLRAHFSDSLSLRFF